MTTLSDNEVDALSEALHDACKALVTNDQVINDFVPIRPFVNIPEADSWISDWFSKDHGVV